MKQRRGKRAAGEGGLRTQVGNPQILAQTRATRSGRDDDESLRVHPLEDLPRRTTDSARGCREHGVSRASGVRGDRPFFRPTSMTRRQSSLSPSRVMGKNRGTGDGEEKTRDGVMYFLLRCRALWEIERPSTTRSCTDGRGSVTVFLECAWQENCRREKGTLEAMEYVYAVRTFPTVNLNQRAFPISMIRRRHSRIELLTQMLLQLDVRLDQRTSPGL